MANSGNLVPESPLVRNRWLIYIMCAATVSLCIGIGIKLVSGPGEPPPPKPGDATPEVAERGGSVPAPNGSGGETEGPRGGSVPRPPPLVPAASEKVRELQEAHRLYDEGLASLKEAMNAESGSEEAHAAMRAALDSMVGAQQAYEAYLEEYPEEESVLDTRLSKLMQNIYWCRKSMPVTEFGANPRTNGGSRPVRPTPPPRERTPPPPVERRFDPAAELAKFRATAARGFREGRPDRVTEIGLPLSTDPRMEGRRAEIPETLALARAMEEFLAAARVGLTDLDGQNVRLELRGGEAVGRLVSGADELKVVAGGDEQEFRVSDLAAGELLTLAGDGGGLTAPDQIRTAGAYLLRRGDREDGARQLLLAQAAGADIGDFADPLKKTMARSPEVRAFAAYIELEPGLSDPGEAVAVKIEAFVAKHVATNCFAEHRPELFRALASARAKDAFKPDDLFAGSAKVSGKSVRLVYEFDDPDEFSDFGSAGEWNVEGGALCGGKASVWLERFDMGDADLRISLLEPAPIVVSLGWGSKDRRQDIRFSIANDPAGMILNVERGRRRIARENLDGLRGKLELLIQKRGDKLQVAVNKKVMAKASEVATREEGPPNFVLVSCGDYPVRIDEIELKTDLDQAWAKAGGKRHAAWIEGYWVTGPFPIDPDDLGTSLDQQEWPDIESFDTARTGENGKPVWRYVACGDRHQVDLNRCFKPHDRVAAYAAVRVWSPKKRNAILEIQVDDDARASLRGEIAIERAPIGSPHRAEVKLVEGDNFLLVKVAETKGAWFLRARILTKSGERMRDVVCW